MPLDPAFWEEPQCRPDKPTTTAMQQCHNCEGKGKVSVPTVTCCAIGPAEAEEIDKITGDLKLL